MGQAAGLLEADGEDGKHVVAVDLLTKLVDKDGAVRVTVERDPDAGALAQHAFSQQLGVQCAAPVVDVEAVGFDPDRGDVGAEFIEHHRRYAVRGAVGAVDDHSQPVEGAAFRNDVLDEHAVAPAGVVELECLADASGGGPYAVDLFPEHKFLDTRLVLVGELEPVGAEELDAVVIEAVVRGRDRHSCIGP